MGLPMGHRECDVQALISRLVSGNQSRLNLLRAGIGTLRGTNGTSPGLTGQMIMVLMPRLVQSKFNLPHGQRIPAFTDAIAGRAAGIRMGTTVGGHDDIAGTLLPIVGSQSLARAVLPAFYVGENSHLTCGFLRFEAFVPPFSTAEYMVDLRE